MKHNLFDIVTFLQGIFCKPHAYWRTTLAVHNNKTPKTSFQNSAGKYPEGSYECYCFQDLQHSMGEDVDWQLPQSRVI